MKKMVLALALGLLIGSASTAMAADAVQAVFAKFSLKVNGELKELKTLPLLVDGTSYLPVREVAGLLGYDVGFEDGTIKLDNMPKTDKSKGDGNVNTVADEWISLIELAESNNLKAGYSEPNGFFKVSKDNITYIEFDASKLKENSIMEVVNSKGQKVRVTVINGTTLFNRSDIKSMGLSD